MDVHHGGNPRDLEHLGRHASTSAASTRRAGAARYPRAMPPLDRARAATAAIALPALVAGCGAPPAPARPVAPPTTSASTRAASPAPARVAGASIDALAAPLGLGPGALAAAARLRDAPDAESQALAIARGLVDAAGPRLAGSPGDKAAVAWAELALTGRGFMNVRVEPATVAHWERGAESASLVAPLARPLALTALGGSVGTAPGGIEAEIVEATSLEAIDALDPDRARGKLVFVNVAMERTRDGAGYSAAAPVRAFAASRAARKGAAGVVVRSIGTDSTRLPHTGVMRYADDAPKIPAAAIAAPDADLLHRLVAAGQRPRLRMTLGARSVGEATSANVVGEIVGAERPDEIVLLAAHLDSWDLGDGALDDAAGCGIVIAAARRLASASPRPRRTVRVVLFAGEENSGGGSKAYAAAHAGELARHVTAIEADLGAGRVLQVRAKGGPEAAPALDLVAALLGPTGAAKDARPAHGGADLEPLGAAGVPFVDLGQDATEYFDHHHTANDTIDKVRPDEIAAAERAFAATAYALASMTATLGRVPEPDRPRPR
jgi:Zn-dependent M28 family amino/carboxypeptidase